MDPSVRAPFVRTTAPVRGTPRSRSVRVPCATHVLLNRVELELLLAMTTSNRSRTARRPFARTRSRDPRTVRGP
eukprot:3500573-Alexandrium_andersonii.AAC.1